MIAPDTQIGRVVKKKIIEAIRYRHCGRSNRVAQGRRAKMKINGASNAVFAADQKLASKRRT